MPSLKKLTWKPEGWTNKRSDDSWRHSEAAYGRSTVNKVYREQPQRLSTRDDYYATLEDNQIVIHHKGKEVAVRKLGFDASTLTKRTLQRTADLTIEDHIKKEARKKKRS